MQKIKYGVNFYIDSSLHVAFAVCALLRITLLNLELSCGKSVLYFSFFGTIVAYNFIKYYNIWLQKNKINTKLKLIFILSCCAFLGAIYFYFYLKSNTKIIAFLAFLLTFLYTYPIFPNKKNIRNLAGIKVYLVALVWVLVTVILPIIEADFYVNEMVIFKGVQRFILVFILLLVFEIVDLQFDGSSLKTIPQQLGVAKTKYLSYFLTIIFLILGILVFKTYMAIALITTLLFLFIYFSSENRSKYYTAFWGEAIPIIWLLLLLFF